MKTQPRGRVAGLDGLRAVSILFVFQAHWEPSAAFGGLQNWGRGGLIAFFVISGYLITDILLNLRNQIDAGKRTKSEAFKNFYGRRSLRIFPIYYLVLAFVVTHNMCTATTQDWLWHAFFLNNFSGVILREQIGVYGPTAPWWSLAVEEQFYIFWALAILLGPRKAFPWLIGTSFIVAICFRYATGSMGQIPVIATPGNIDCLAAGATVAMLVRTRLAESNLYRRLAIALLSAASIVFAWTIFTKTQSVVFSDVVWYALFTPIVFMLAVRSYPILGSALDNRIMVFIGKRSYGAYILHQVVCYFIFQRFQPFLSLYGPKEFIVYSTVTIILATISYRFFEVPVLQIRDGFFPSGNKRGALSGPLRPPQIYGMKLE